MTFFNGVTEDLKEVLKRVDDIGTWKTYNHYPVGWAHAMCTPFQWTKQIASHYGGTRNGMVISWPKGIAAKGELRTQWHHCIDIVPTILRGRGVTAPTSVNGVTQKPIEGVSMTYTFADAKATEPADHAVLRDARQPGDLLTTAGLPAPRRRFRPGIRPAPTADVITGYQWELYHTDTDFSQAEDLAAQNAGEAQGSAAAQFYTEAARYNVLPIDNSKTTAPRPGHPAEPDARAQVVHRSTRA